MAGIEFTGKGRDEISVKAGSTVPEQPSGRPSAIKFVSNGGDVTKSFGTNTPNSKAPSSGIIKSPTEKE